MMRRPPRSTRFPSPRLFRSPAGRVNGHAALRRLGPDLLAPDFDEAEALARLRAASDAEIAEDRKSTRLNSSHANISYAVFCLKQKNTSAALFYPGLYRELSG